MMNLILHIFIFLHFDFPKLQYPRWRSNIPKRAGLLALLCVIFSCVFVNFLCGVLGQVWYLIVYIPDLFIMKYLFIVICMNTTLNVCLDFNVLNKKLEDGCQTK